MNAPRMIQNMQSNSGEVRGQRKHSESSSKLVETASSGVMRLRAFLLEEIAHQGKGGIRFLEEYHVPTVRENFKLRLDKMRRA